MTSDANSPSEGWGQPRSQTVSWWDPMIGARAMRSLSGREYLQAMIDGRLPPAPIGGLIAMTAVSVGEGTVKFRCRPDESAYNPIGVVHGGLVCTLLDSVPGCAVHSTLPAGVGYTSLEIKVSYLRPVRQGQGELTATGRVTKPGRRAAFADGEVRDEHGRLIATASSTCLVFPLRRSEATTAAHVRGLRAIEPTGHGPSTMLSQQRPAEPSVARSDVRTVQTCDDGSRGRRGRDPDCRADKHRAPLARRTYDD